MKVVYSPDFKGSLDVYGFKKHSLFLFDFFTHYLWNELPDEYKGQKIELVNGGTCIEKNTKQRFYLIDINGKVVIPESSMDFLYINDEYSAFVPLYEKQNSYQKEYQYIIQSKDSSLLLFTALCVSKNFCIVSDKGKQFVIDFRNNEITIFDEIILHSKKSGYVVRLFNHNYLFISNYCKHLLPKKIRVSKGEVLASSEKYAILRYYDHDSFVITDTCLNQITIISPENYTGMQGDTIDDTDDGFCIDGKFYFYSNGKPSFSIDHILYNTLLKCSICDPISNEKRYGILAVNDGNYEVIEPCLYHIIEDFYIDQYTYIIGLKFIHDNKSFSKILLNQKTLFGLAETDIKIQKLEFSEIDPRNHSLKNPHFVETAVYKISTDDRIYLFDSEKMIPILGVVDLRACKYIEFHVSEQDYGSGYVECGALDFLRQNFIVENDKGFLGIVNKKGEQVVPMICNEIIVFASIVIAGDCIYYANEKPIYNNRIGETISLFKIHRDYLIFTNKKNELIFINHVGAVYKDCKCVEGIITLYEKGDSYIKYNVEKDSFEERITEYAEDDEDYADEGYTDNELRSMYLDAFEGNFDNEWNIE